MTDRVQVQRAINLLDGRWTLPIFAQLVQVGRRYQDLHDALDGTSYKVLTETLRRSERDGLIARHLDGERIETATLYELSALGRRLWCMLEGALGGWESVVVLLHLPRTAWSIALRLGGQGLDAVVEQGDQLLTLLVAEDGSQALFDLLESGVGVGEKSLSVAGQVGIEDPAVTLARGQREQLSVLEVGQELVHRLRSDVHESRQLGW